jgi:hypothetical protein
MRPYFLSVCLLFIGAFTVIAQEKVKFGEVPMSDLSMTVYPEDTTAIAVTLHEDCEVWYEFVRNNFHNRTTYTIRVFGGKKTRFGSFNIFLSERGVIRQLP